MFSSRLSQAVEVPFGPPFGSKVAIEMARVEIPLMLYATLPIITDLVRDAASPLTGANADYDALLEFIGDARFVLLGEASHGTHEFYRQRAQITKRLIQEKGFTAVAVEADWPDAYRVNRYVRGQGTDADAVEALSGFKRFPAWMWRNADAVSYTHLTLPTIYSV